MRRIDRRVLLGRFGGAVLALASLWGCLLSAGAQEVGTAAGKEGGTLVRWPYLQPVELPSAAEPAAVDFLLTPTVFDGASVSLDDLRLTAGTKETPYALRIREPKDEREKVNASIYNRTKGPDRSTEVWIDLGQEGVEHNEIQVKMQGDNFRRRVVLEGSSDAHEWRQLQERPLFRFQAGNGPAEDLNLSYPVSRFRYLRARAYEDPTLDHEPVAISSVSVYRTVRIPGEMLTLPASVGAREPVRGNDAPASAWVLELGGQHIPCSELEVDFGDASFARDYYLEAAGPAGAEEPFGRIYSDVWRRVDGETKPLVAKFSEVRAARLRLVVIDHENPPLDLRSVKFRAAARQVIFVPPKEAQGSVHLYYGNPEAQAPNYDYARNLPEQLNPAPVRATLGPRESNPNYVPKPLPLTERWPWLIYLVLGAVSLVLAVVVVQVARQAIARHDAELAKE